jgi:hypothetical protein
LKHINLLSAFELLLRENNSILSAYCKGGEF